MSDDIVLSGPEQNMHEEVFLMFCRKAEGIVNGMKKPDGSWDLDAIASHKAKLENAIIILKTHLGHTSRIQQIIEDEGSEADKKALREAAKKYRPQVARQKEEKTRFQKFVDLLIEQAEADGDELSREDAEARAKILFLGDKEE